jgi:hypothetical protein
MEGFFEKYDSLALPMHKPRYAEKSALCLTFQHLAEAPLLYLFPKTFMLKK